MRPVRIIAAVVLTAAVAATGSLIARSTAGHHAAAPAAPVAAAPTAPANGPATNPPSPQGGATSGQPVVLADGRHPVYLRTVDPDSRKLTFDLIQFYFGDDAAREAAKDGKESPPPNDYYIRNVNPALRTLPMRADAPITVNTLAAGYTGSATRNVNVQLSRLKIMLDFRGYSPPFWITVRNDQVIRIAEQYLP
jgi:hypothetical protein